MTVLEPNTPAVVADLDAVVNPGDNLLCHRRKDGSWYVGIQRSNLLQRKRLQISGSGPDFASAVNDLYAKL